MTPGRSPTSTRWAACCYEALTGSVPYPRERDVDKLMAHVIGPAARSRAEAGAPGGVRRGDRPRDGARARRPLSRAPARWGRPRWPRRGGGRPRARRADPVPQPRAVRGQRRAHRGSDPPPPRRPDGRARAGAVQLAGHDAGDVGPPAAGAGRPLPRAALRRARPRALAGATEGPYSMGDLGGDVVELLDRLEIERASFCGISIGGMVGLWLAINAPERIDRLVLCCTAAQVLSAADWQERADTVRSRAWSRWPTPPSTAGSRPSSGRRRPSWWPPSARPWWAPMPRATRAVPRPSPATTCASELGSITAPTLVVTAADDPSIPPEHGELIAERVPERPAGGAAPRAPPVQHRAPRGVQPGAAGSLRRRGTKGIEVRGRRLATTWVATFRSLTSAQ